MDPITRFCAFILCFGIYVSFAYFLYWIYTVLDKHSKKKSSEKIEIRRKEFKLECERAGKDLMLHDELQELKEKSIRFQPIRKAVGYFSDDMAQALLQ